MVHFMIIGTFSVNSARSLGACLVLALVFGSEARHVSAGQIEKKAAPSSMVAMAEAAEPAMPEVATQTIELRQLPEAESASAPVPEQGSPLERQLAAVHAEWEENARAGRPNPLHLHETANRIREALCEEGETDYCVIPKTKNVDIDRLSYAVAVAETSNCTKGTGVSKRNCHGIFECKNGKCGPKTFANTAQSHIAFKQLWLKAYGDHFPTLSDAKRYSGGPGDTWLYRVTVAYQSRR
jgi:hypothetical protein